jgi:integrase
MPIHLNETAIAREAKSVAQTKKRRDLSDKACLGLRLRLTPAGGKAWVLCCRDRFGQTRRFPLGSYPTMGVSAARDAARALHTKVKHDGADPIADRRRDRAMGASARKGEGTLSALLDAYAEKRGNTLRSWAEARKRIGLVFKALLNKPALVLTDKDFQAEADSYASASSAAFAVRSVRPALKWGVARGMISEGATRLRAPAPAKRRKRVLAQAELAKLVPALRETARPYGDALLFMLLTLVRRQEAAAARWGDVDLAAETFSLPGERTKNEEPHVVPLSRQVVELLRARKPAKVKPTAFVFCTSSGGMLGNWDRETKEIQEASGTAGWTRHDLRRTGATMLGEMGELPDIIEAALNHVSIHSPLAATYNRSRYRPQVKAALQKLADLLDEIAPAPREGDATELEEAA